VKDEENIIKAVANGTLPRKGGVEGKRRRLLTSPINDGEERKPDARMDCQTRKGGADSPVNEVIR